MRTLGRDKNQQDTTPKPVKDIDVNTGLVTFDDGSDTGVAGTREDCRAYGYNFENNKCFIQSGNEKANTGNLVVGGHNNVTGKNNKVYSTKSNVNANNAQTQGTNHEVTADFATVIGNGGSAIRYSEYVHAQTPHQQSVSVGNRARAQRSVLMYQGRTTDGTARQEIFIGGIDNERFIVDENFEGIISFSARCLGKAVTFRNGSYSTGAYSHFEHVSYRVNNGVLTELGQDSESLHTDNATGWNNGFSATSATPDYITVDVTGARGVTIDWTVILYINELRTTLS